MPPNPDTIFAGFVSRSFGNIVPREIAIEFSPTQMRIIAMEYSIVSSILIFKRALERNIRIAVMDPVMQQDVTSFWIKICSIGIGHMDNIHNLFPSRLNCGKTNLVVNVERAREQTPRLSNEIISIQNGV